MAKKSKKYRFTRKSALLSAVAVLVIVGIGVGWHYYNRTSQQVSSPNTTSGSAGTYANLNPATPQDKQTSTDAKNAQVQQSTTPPPTSSDGKMQVTPTIISVSATQVKAQIDSIFEQDGTCTATATNTSTSAVVTGTSQGEYSGSQTSCVPISLSSTLTSGTWSVVVTYSSPTAEGSSPATVKEIP